MKRCFIAVLLALFCIVSAPLDSFADKAAQVDSVQLADEHLTINPEVDSVYVISAPSVVVFAFLEPSAQVVPEIQETGREAVSHRYILPKSAKISYPSLHPPRVLRR